MNDLIIGKRCVSNNGPVLIIAEAGINHDGNYEQALKLIDAAVYAKADIVKFQLFKASKMYTSKAGNYKTANGTIRPINDILKESELPESWIPKLMDYCDKKGIGFLCTVCDEGAADVLNNFGVDSFKMASYAITHLPLMEHVAGYNKPIVFSEAGAYLSDVDIALRTIKKYHNKIALLHCVAKYPTPLNECNLNVIKTYKMAFPDIIIGYSDHTADPYKAPITAVYCGAKIIEKHFTIDKNLPGADHSFSLNPDELKLMVDSIRKFEKMSAGEKENAIYRETLGTSIKTLNEIEVDLRKYAFRCLFATSDIEIGDVLSIDNVAVLRPGNAERGIEPSFYNYLINTKVRAVRKIEKGNSIKWEDLLTI